MGYVLGAGAIISFLRDEPGADVLEEKLIEAGRNSDVDNLGEVYHGCLQPLFTPPNKKKLALNS